MIGFKEQRRLEALARIGWTDRPMLTNDDVWAEWESFIRTAYAKTSILGLALMVEPEISGNSISNDMDDLGITKTTPGGHHGTNNIRKLYLNVDGVKYHLLDFAKEFGLTYSRVYYWKKVMGLSDQEIVARAKEIG